MKRAIMSLICAALLALSLAGCGRTGEASGSSGQSGTGDSAAKEAIDGGVEDHSDKKAPKEIRSKELVSLRTSFFAFDDFSYDGGGLYRYELGKDGDRLILRESSCYKIETEASDDLLAEAEKLIEKYDLAALNGTDKVTNGLPAEFQPCSFAAKYASGEKLTFYTDGDPEAEWMKAFRKLFNSAFTEAGFEETAPDPDDYAIDHFTLAFNEGDLAYEYGTIVCRDKTRVFCQVWDMDKSASVSEHYAGMEDGFLEKFSEKIEELGLQRLHSDSHEDPAHTPDGYLEIYIDYLSGRQIYGTYGPEEIPEEWESARAELKAFLDTYIEEHLEAASWEELSALTEG